MGQAILLKILASTLMVDLGTLHITLAHAHIYEPHFKMARTALEKSNFSDPIGPCIMNNWTIQSIYRSKNAFVETYKKFKLPVNLYNPKVDIVL